MIRPDGSVDNNPKRFIPLAKCLEILDDCREMRVGGIQITGGGEPTVHPDHVEVYRAVLDRGLDLALVSNGTLLRDDGIPPLMRAKWIRLSLDAGNADTYGRTREVPAAYFERTLKNLRRLCEARDAAGSDVVIGVGFVVTAENWREVAAAARHARDAGADNLRISAVFQPDGAAYFSDFHAAAATECRKAAELAGGRFKVFNNFGERLEDLTDGPPDYRECGIQHFSTYIAATLDVFRCCVLAYNERGLVGSIKDQRFRDLWESQAKRDDYAAFDARGCERCMFNGKNRTIAYALAEEPAHVNFV